MRNRPASGKLAVSFRLSTLEQATRTLIEAHLLTQVTLTLETFERAWARDYSANKCWTLANKFRSRSTTSRLFAL
jgi:hypothetical protein